MTTITIDRNLLEQVLDVLITRGAQPGYETERAWLKTVKSLEAALSAPATALEQHRPFVPWSKEAEMVASRTATVLEAELAATEIAIAEYRQQCIDNHAEIERLRAESDERLKNTVAQAMEIERLRPDAERYRHIRSKKSRDHNHHSKRALEAGICDWSRSLDQNSTCSFWSTADLTEEALDEAVDASIKEKP